MRNLKISAKIALSFLFPILLVLALAGYVVVDKARVVSETAHLARISPLTAAISAVVHELQKERGASAVYIGSKGDKFHDELKAQRQATDQAAARMEAVLSGLDLQIYGADLAVKIKAAQDRYAA